MSDDIDNQLAAFLDGAMDDADAAAFEARLAADPQLAARAEQWLSNDCRIAAALAPIALDPITPALLDRLGLGESAPSAPPGTRAANDNSPWWRRHALPLGGAVAAGLAAILLLTPHAANAPRRDLSFALETGVSLSPVKLADGSTVTPTLTVRAADGRYCREYREARGVGLACREGGRWKVEARGQGDGPADNVAIGVAGGADASALDAGYRRIGASDPLDARTEAGLIAKGWPGD
jgi:hypothetical protein